MFNARSSLAQLLAAPMRPGHIVWVGLRPQRKAALLPVEAVLAQAGQGLKGDHYKTQRDGKRQVTLIQAEDLAAIASYLGRHSVEPGELRRNLVTQGINLLVLKGKQFQVGNVLLEYTGECHPCSRMEATFGTGGYNAVRGHGGITARILTSGEIRLGSEVAVVNGAKVNRLGSGYHQ